MNRTQTQKGFSLIELMVVVAIIGILATLAVPQVNKFMAKARQAEAKTNLSAMYTANKAFFAEYNGYHTVFQVIGYAPEGNVRYWAGFANQRGNAPQGYNGSVAGQSNSQTYCVASGGKCTLLPEGQNRTEAASVSFNGQSNNTEATDTYFWAGAAAELIRGSGKIDVWGINQNKNLFQSQNGID